MTYIVGFKQPGVNTILSDTRVTRDDPDASSNTAIKTGELFPGCIYGRAGSQFHSEKFIRRFREMIRGSRDTHLGFWHQFQQFAEVYEFPTRTTDRFQLLLSTRAFGHPKFYTLSADSGLSRVHMPKEAPIITYGKGKGYLDSRVYGDFQPWLAHIQEYLLDGMGLSHGDILDAAPYCLCLRLSELSLTFEKGRLEEEYGVGGLFHFISQNSTGEYRQQPAVYIFSALDSSLNVLSFIFRAVRIPTGLYVEEILPRGHYRIAPDGRKVSPFCYALLDSIARQDLSLDRPDFFLDDEGRMRIPEEFEQQLQQAMREEIDPQPFYHFCGFGFTDPRYRNIYKVLVHPAGRVDDILDEDGRLQPSHRRHIDENFSITSIRTSSSNRPPQHRL